LKESLLAEISRDKALPGINPAQWGTGILLSFLTAFLLWLVIQPGVVFAWESEHEFEYYQVYRSPAGKHDYIPVSGQKPASRGAEYRFVDPLVIPGQSYHYLVEGITPEGQTISLQTITSDTAAVLLAQLAIIISSLTWSAGLLTLANARDRFAIPIRTI
jgi:hypothetical protein